MFWYLLKINYLCGRNHTDNTTLTQCGHCKISYRQHRFADATRASTSIAIAIEVIEVCAVAYPDDIHAEPVKVKTILTDYKDYEVGKSTKLSDFFAPCCG